MTMPFKSFIDQLDELTQREKEMIAQRKSRRGAGRLKKKTKTPVNKKSDAQPTAQRKTDSVGNTRDSSDQHIVVQLRKAQDVDGNTDIKVAPNKTVRLEKDMIDKLLKMHDNMQKPEQKRKFRVDLIKKLRKM